METILINGILYLVFTKDDLYNPFGIEIDADYGLVYVGPESGVFTDEVIEVPESGEYNEQTVPVVGFAGGMLLMETQNLATTASVSEVILPSTILFLMLGFTYFTNLQKVTCYAESTPKLIIMGMEIPIEMDFEGTPDTKELYIPSGSDYSTWRAVTTWGGINDIYDEFVEIVNGLKYKATSENTVALIGYDDTFAATSLTIPSSITYEGKTYTVTEIKNNVFKNYTGLTSVAIPDSVTKISETAFSNTEFEVQTIDVNNISLNLISIDTRLDKFVLKNTSGITFTYGNITETSTVYGCECLGLTDTTIDTPTLDLTNLVYDNHQLSIYTIKEEAFANNNSIITAILPEETKLIEGLIFDNCQNLDTIYFNCKSAKSLSMEPFFGYNNYIKTIIIGNSVTYIGCCAFQYCSSLTSITIPDNVTSIGGSAFQDCSSLTSITIPDSVTCMGIFVFSGCSSLTSVTIPNSVTYIGSGEFQDCSSLTSITIPDSVTCMGIFVFSGCSSLTSVTIPNSVTYIGGNAFAYCELTSVYLLNPTAPTSYESHAFQYTPSTKVLFVPIDATGYSTSWGGTTWAAVNPVMIPTEEIVYKFNDEHLLETFSSNNKTESLTIPHNVVYKGNGYNVEKLSRNSLANDNKIKTLTIESGINKIEASALSGCNNLETVNIPATVSKIDNHAFWMCKNLKNVVLPSNLTKLKPEMFVACEELQEITIPNGITTIPFRMFEGCRNLTTVNLPDTITEIQWSAFKDCVNLTTINKPDGCTVDPTAFEGTNIQFN